jgi:hypothetical protein
MIFFVCSQTPGIFLFTGPVISKSFWTSLLEWIGAYSFDHANKKKRSEIFFTNTESAALIWFSELLPLGRDQGKETEPPSSIA